MTIRDATIEDLPAIVAIYNSTIASRMVTADLEPVSVASREKWFAEHSPARHPIWVACENEKVIGWLSYSSFNARPAYARTAEISVYLAPEHRKSGLGTVLVKRCIEHAPSIGITNLVGLVFAHNQPSLRMLEKLGFVRWGQLPRVAVLDGVERDLIYMGRRV